MNDPIERELKILISREEYEKIIHSYDFEKQIKQTNTYYDTQDNQIKKCNGALRIRKINNQNIFTLKIKKDDITHYEYEKQIDVDTIKEIKDPEILEWCSMHHISLDVEPIVSFTTYRSVLNLKQAQICADITMFDQATDYEIEYEYRYEHDGISYFNQILEPIHKQYIKNCPSKIARAFLYQNL